MIAGRSTRLRRSSSSFRRSLPSRVIGVRGMAMAPILRQAPAGVEDSLAPVPSGKLGDHMRISALGPIALVLLLIAGAGCSQSDAQSSPPPKDAAKAAPRRHQAAADHGGEGRGPRGPALGRDGGQPPRLGRRAGRTEQPGTIARLLVDLGDAVARGQVLAEYDAREFELAVKQAERRSPLRPRVARPRAGHRRRQRGGASPRQGRPGPRSTPRWRAPQSQVEWAKSELERNRNALPQGAHRRARRRQCAQPVQHRGGLAGQSP